jgi:hypothetical protein
MALPDYLEDTSKDFAKQLTATTSVPIDTTKFTGRQFVGGEDPLQTQAIGIAQQGVGSYQPFLTAAQQAGVSGATTLGTAATALGGCSTYVNSSSRFSANNWSTSYSSGTRLHVSFSTTSYRYNTCRV